MHTILPFIGKGLLALAFVVFLFLAVLVIRSLLLPKKQAGYIKTKDPIRQDLYARKLAAMVQQPTVSSKTEPYLDSIEAFHTVLKEQFPLVFEKLDVWKKEGNLLLHWKGKGQMDPILMMSHQDVVAVSDGWSHPPFGAEIEDGLMYGRGTGDTKGSLMAIFQSVEELLADGYEPSCDVYIASSCTEEIGGPGAGWIAERLQDQKISLFLICDEGGGIIEDPLPGISGPFGLVGIQEKGQGNLKITARSKGGHASVPGKRSPLVRLSAFMLDVEKNNPMQVSFEKPVLEMFYRLAPYARGPVRLIFANTGLLTPVLKKIMPSISSQGAAMLQTTVAFTMAKGSAQPNNMPDSAYVIANLRYAPHQNGESSLQALQKVADKYDLEIEVLSSRDATPLASPEGKPFQLLEKTIAKTFPHLACIPYLVTGATDCTFYQDICKDTLRFAPVVYSPQALASMHGIDEHLPVDCLVQAVDFYKNLIRMQEER